MKKGFTLIELLAVITIIALLALLTSTVITKFVKDTKEDLSETQLQLIRLAAETWGADNKESLPDENNCKYLLLSDLKNEGLLDSKIVDAATNNEIPNDLKIKITSTTGKNENIVTTYEVNSDSVENCKWVYYKPYVDKSGANLPELVDGLVPVIYKEDHWKVADTTQEWYNYDEQEWANAVILSETGKSKQVGDTLTLPTTAYDTVQFDVVAMFVWIPRYEYKIEGQYGKHTDGSDGTKTLPGEIKVNFIEKGTTKASSDGYIIHPAFTFGEDDLSGIWVGKFETSHTTSGTKLLTCTDENCSDADSLRILPNVASLRSNPVSKFFFASRSMTREGNPFKLNASTTDSHMMKNSEWGAVAYLSQSKYGKYGNSEYEGANKEIYKNNSSSFYTGRSGGASVGSIAQVKDQYPDSSSTVTNEYYNYGYYTYDGYKLEYDGTISEERELLKGTGASTTGNITGVYDMSGGAYEYVMGYLTTAYTTTPSENLPWGSTSSIDYAKFTQAPESKYYDAYIDTNKNNEAYKGQALGETSGWYSDFAIFVSTGFPWLGRGGCYSDTSYAGVFDFVYGSGGGNGSSNISFRVVLAPTT